MITENKEKISLSRKFIGIIIRRGVSGMVTFRVKSSEDKWYRGWHSETRLSEMLEYVDAVVESKHRLN